MSVACTCSVVILGLLAVAGTMIVLSFYARGIMNSLQDKDVVFGPGDTQNMFFSPLFCEQLSPDADTLYSSAFEPSYLYLLDRDPFLTGKSNITFQDEFVIFDKQKLRTFHFYANSVIKFDACLDNATYAGAGRFFLIRGKDVYEEWKQEGEELPPPFIDNFQVRTLCSAGKQSYNYTVTEEDQYYLMFVNDRHLSPYPSDIVVDYDIQRTAYEFNDSSILDSCKFTTSPCSVRVPLRISASTLLAYGAPVDWEDDWRNRGINIRCAPRIWLYTLLSAVGVLAIIGVTFCLCATCCCCGMCFPQEEDEATRPLLGKHTADLYGKSSSSSSNSEMTDPSRDTTAGTGAISASSNPQVAFRKPNSPYPPPSFKRSDKFSLGSPTCETFASNNNH